MFANGLTQLVAGAHFSGGFASFGFVRRDVQRQ